MTDDKSFLDPRRLQRMTHLKAQLNTLLSDIFSEKRFRYFEVELFRIVADFFRFRLH